MFSLCKIHTGKLPYEAAARDVLTLLGYDWQISCFYFHDSWGYEVKAHIRKNSVYVSQHSTAREAMSEVLMQVLEAESKG
jgi:hypothetical protein